MNNINITIRKLSPVTECIVKSIHLSKQYKSAIASTTIGSASAATALAATALAAKALAAKALAPGRLGLRCNHL